MLLLVLDVDICEIELSKRLVWIGSQELFLELLEFVFDSVIDRVAAVYLLLALFDTLQILLMILDLIGVLPKGR